MTPEQSLSILDQATQPNAQLKRDDYVLIAQALKVYADLIKSHKDKTDGPEKPE